MSTNISRSTRQPAPSTSAGDTNQVPVQRQLPLGPPASPGAGRPPTAAKRRSARRAPPRRAPRRPARTRAGRLTPHAVLSIAAPGQRAPGRATLRRALLATGAPRRCATCAAPPSWLGEPLSLEVHHVNGDERDNRPHNLRLLCPNCRAQAAAQSRRRARRHAADLPRGQPRWQQQELFGLAA